MLLWQRYLTWMLGRSFILLLVMIWALYALLDCSAHMQSFVRTSGFALFPLLHYYLCCLVKQAHLIVPISLLLASLRLLSSLEQRRELLAFQAGGLSSHAILRPLLLFAWLIALLLFASEEFLMPRAWKGMQKFEAIHLHKSGKGKKKEPIHILHLKDHSFLAYQKYLFDRESLFDVLWVVSHSEVWKIKYLKPDPICPQGYFVEHILMGKPTKEGGTQVTRESFEERSFPELHWKEQLSKRGYTTLQAEPLSRLVRIVQDKKSFSELERQEAATQLMLRSSLPFFCPLLLLGISSSCMRYRRGGSVFLVATISLFSLIACFFILDAATILSETAIISPSLAMGIPMLIVTGICLWRYQEL